MLSLAEIGPALYGAWRLAHFDADGMRYFDRSIGGLWRSFRVAVLAAPLWIVIMAIDFAPMHIGGGWFRVVLAEAIAYVMSWVTFPLAAFYLTRYIDRQREFPGFVVALNWSTLLQLGILLPAHGIAGAGLLPYDAGLVVALSAEIACLVYEWFITRSALNISGLGAVGFVLVDYVIGSVINQIAAVEAYAS